MPMVLLVHGKLGTVVVVHKANTSINIFQQFRLPGVIAKMVGARKIRDGLRATYHISGGCCFGEALVRLW